MKITDNGPGPNVFDLETATVENSAYRTVAWTGRYLQVTLMSIPPGQSIGLEVHPETDQFVRIDAGEGHVVMGPAESCRHPIRIRAVPAIDNRKKAGGAPADSP